MAFGKASRSISLAALEEAVQITERNQGGQLRSGRQRRGVEIAILASLVDAYAQRQEPIFASPFRHGLPRQGVVAAHRDVDHGQQLAVREHHGSEIVAQKCGQKRGGGEFRDRERQADVGRVAE